MSDIFYSSFFQMFYILCDVEFAFMHMLHTCPSYLQAQILCIIVLGILSTVYILNVLALLTFVCSILLCVIFLKCHYEYDRYHLQILERLYQKLWIIARFGCRQQQERLMLKVVFHLLLSQYKLKTSLTGRVSIAL